jgi:hypothetical protein
MGDMGVFALRKTRAESQDRNVAARRAGIPPPTLERKILTLGIDRNRFKTTYTLIFLYFSNGPAVNAEESWPRDYRFRDGRPSPLKRSTKSRPHMSNCPDRDKFLGRDLQGIRDF